MSMLSPWRQGFCGKMTGRSTGTLPVSGQRSGTGSETVLRFLTSHTVSTEGRAGCPGLQTMPLTGSDLLKTPKSSVRCKAEHPCRIVKNIFGFQKAVYRGQRKNLNRLYVLFARANLYMLARAGGSPCPARGFCALRPGWDWKSEEFIPQYGPLLDVSISFVCLPGFCLL